jgi:hypothetical protein
MNNFYGPHLPLGQTIFAAAHLTGVMELLPKILVTEVLITATTPGISREVCKVPPPPGKTSLEVIPKV